MTENGNHDKKKSGGEISHISNATPVYLKTSMKRKRQLSKPFEEEPPKSLANIRDKDVDSSSSKVDKNLKGILDSILSPSPSENIQIMGGKVCLRCKGKTMLGIVDKFLKTNSLLTSSSNVWPYYLKQIFSPI